MSRIRQRGSDTLLPTAGGATTATAASTATLQVGFTTSDFEQLATLDLGCLGDQELTTFLAQTVEMLDTLSAASAALEQSTMQPQQPQQNNNNNNFSPGRARANHSRLAASVSKCLNSMPWGRLYAVATVSANLEVAATKQQKSSQKKLRPFAQTNQEIATTKSVRKKIIILYSLVCVKLAEIAPAQIPDLLSATLKYFSHIPPAAQVSMKAWLALPPTLSTAAAPAASSSSTDQQQQQQQAAALPSSSPSSSSSSMSGGCRAFASALTTWLENEVDVHLFRVVCSLLSRYEEENDINNNYNEQPSATTAASQLVQRQHAAIAARARHNCEVVLERSIPKKRWPIVAHHLSWFSLFAKFFSKPHLEAVARSMSELRFPSSNRAAAAAASTATAEKRHQLAQHVEDRVVRSWRSTVLKYMLNGLVNLEVSAMQGREATLAARRCACYVIDAVVGCVGSAAAETETSSSASSSLASATSEELFLPILEHFLSDVAYLHPSLACVHSVVTAAAVALDRSCNTSTTTTTTNINGSPNVAKLIVCCCRQLEQLCKSSALAQWWISSSARNSSSSSTYPNINKTVGNKSGPEIPNELIVFSHLTGALKQLTLLSQQGLNNMNDRSFWNNNNNNNNGANTKNKVAPLAALKSLTNTCVETVASSSSSASSLKPFAIWLLRDVVVPLASAADLSEISSVMDRPPPSTTMSSPQKRKQQQQEDDAAAATTTSRRGVPDQNRDSSSRSSSSSSSSNGNSRDEEEEEEDEGSRYDSADDEVVEAARTVSSMFLDVPRLPDVTGRIWRCYTTFSRELLPF